ncbi:alanine/ornithine racemase family PLP-dependent enzyme, partial [Erysipelotrichaceae bacterium OttesenSCG-928-M19]|nr:alanine/ornithine racemase family PLP-dependent enzyme [Erysipelotrichaceae bacterium OttesenSCG-928-M19]
MYPRININLKHLEHNIKYLRSELKNLDEVFVVTKAYSAYKPILDVVYQCGVRHFADSRSINLKIIKERFPDVTTMQLRLPMASEIDELIKYADRSLNSEIETIRLIDEACEKANLTHDIILMIDVGDLREGIMFDSDYKAFVKEILSFKNINLIGIGTNVTCYGSIIPTKETLELLVKIKEDIEKEFSIEIPHISGGNSSSIYLHFENNLPKEITNLRIGDAFISGIEAAYSQLIPNMHDDIFQLEAQIIELKEKPSYPIGQQGVNAFGETVEYDDVGIHTRAIVAIGRQDISQDDLIPLDDKVKVLGSSSDHLILEINSKEYKIG